MTRISFLSIQGSYKHVEVALFSNSTCIDFVQEESKKASTLLVPTIHSLLRKNGVLLGSLAFVAIDQGPGAFTSLRVSMTTANALGFARNIPLIGIDGLLALAKQTAASTHKKYGTIAALLNAFNKDMYYGIYTKNNNELKQAMQHNYEPANVLFDRLEHYGATPLIFSGNGAHLFKSALQKRFPRSTFLPTMHASAQQIGRMAYKQWKQGGDFPRQLSPLYLKIQRYTPKYS